VLGFAVLRWADETLKSSGVRGLRKWLDASSAVSTSFHHFINQPLYNPHQVDNVADVDGQRFQLHPSVPFWRTWGTQMDTRSLGNNISGRCVRLGALVSAGRTSWLLLTVGSCGVLLSLSLSLSLPRTPLNSSSTPLAPPHLPPPYRSRASASSMAEAALALFSSSALQDAESAAYWTYHFARTGFFLGTVSNHYDLGA
jgi:hypothetical protein